MDGKQGAHQAGHQGRSHLPPNDRGAHTNDGNQDASLISIEQLQRLVRLLDHSDVSELELTRAEEGSRLVLRKAKASEPVRQPIEAALNGQMPGPAGGTQIPGPVSTPMPVETKRVITAHLVGIFHRWAKPRGGVLVAVGDHIKAGQLVGTIESLNVINEVESAYAGEVVEILVQEGQPVEYGQHLIVIDSSPKD